jgi:hypothetical protein
MSFTDKKQNILTNLENLINQYDDFSKSVDSKHWRITGHHFTDLNRIYQEFKEFTEISEKHKENSINRTLIYKEDAQMYYFTPVVFETNADISVETMKEISYEPAGAGRHSTSFETFKELMNEHGYIVREIKKLDRNTIPDDNILEIVEGATGNY